MLWLLRREEDRGKLEEWQRCLLAGNERLLGSLARWLGWVWFSSSLFFSMQMTEEQQGGGGSCGGGASRPLNFI